MNKSSCRVIEIKRMIEFITSNSAYSTMDLMSFLNLEHDVINFMSGVVQNSNKLHELMYLYELILTEL